MAQPAKAHASEGEPGSWALASPLVIERPGAPALDDACEPGTLPWPPQLLFFFFFFFIYFFQIDSINIY
jgi:hypothetical protein